jgi:branched-chain amino acid transport system substrate-binding protein
VKARSLLPIAAILLALWFGYREYAAGRLVLPGVPSTTTQTQPGDEAEEAQSQPQTQPQTTQPEATQPQATEPQTTQPQKTQPQTTPEASTPPAQQQPTTPQASRPAPTTGYPEASLREPDTSPAVNLRPERAEILNTYANGAYADTIAKASAWLNAHPTDALVAIARSNALQRQLGRDVVTIGVSLPTSGASVQSGEAMLQGINLALSQANREGVRGRRVVVAIRNDQNDRALAVEAASSFAGNDDVLGVIGPIGSSATLDAADVYNSAGLAHIAPTATNNRLANAGDYTYRLAPSDAAQGRALARFASERGYTRVPVYYDPSDAYSKGLADAFIAEAQTLNVSAYPFTFKTGSLPDQDGFDTFSDPPVPDAAFISGTYADVARIAKELRERDQNVPLLAGDAAYSQALLSEGGAAVEGLTLVSFFLATADLPNVPAFVKQFRAAYAGGTPNARAAQAYDATRTLIEAIRRAASLDREGVKTALDSFTSAKPGPGVTSPIAFNNGAIVGRPFVVIEVKDGKLAAVDTIK